MTTERERDDAHRAPAARAGQTAPRDKPQDEIPPEKLSTPPSSPPLLGGKQILPVFGPFAGALMVIPQAEADQAIADKWAIAAPTGPVDANATQPDPLTDQERTDATTAAKAWADAQNPQADAEAQKQQHEKPPREPAQQSRSMHPGAAGYETREERPAAAPAPDTRGTRTK